MRRFLFFVSICCLLGVVTTYGVAWWCALTVDLGISGQPNTGATYRTNAAWWIDRRGRPGAVRLESIRTYDAGRFEHLGRPDVYSADDLALPWMAFHGETPVDAEHDIDYRIFDGRGWPRLAVWCEFVRDANGRWSTNPIHGGFALQASTASQSATAFWSELRALPLRPIWSGFAFNTLLFSAGWFALFFALGQTRRGYRRARGRCPRCAYDLRGGTTGGCPECGWERRGTVHDPSRG